MSDFMLLEVLLSPYKLQRFVAKCMRIKFLLRTSPDSMYWGALIASKLQLDFGREMEGKGEREGREEKDLRGRQMSKGYLSSLVPPASADPVYGRATYVCIGWPKK